MISIREVLFEVIPMDAAVAAQQRRDRFTGNRYAGEEPVVPDNRLRYTGAKPQSMQDITTLNKPKLNINQEIEKSQDREAVANIASKINKDAEIKNQIVKKPVGMVKKAVGTQNVPTPTTAAKTITNQETPAPQVVKKAGGAMDDYSEAAKRFASGAQKTFKAGTEAVGDMTKKAGKMIGSATEHMGDAIKEHPILAGALTAGTVLGAKKLFSKPKLA